ncbi:hypothetical protein CPB83DRAFT_773766, partial [Crepidotus variabilis]
ILDKEQRVIAVLAGTPTDVCWPSVLKNSNHALQDALEQGLQDGTFSSTEMSHRRGEFYLLVDGISYGGGQKKPGNLKLTRKEEGLMDGLKNLPCIRRIAGFQDACFALYAPKLYVQYRTLLLKLYDREPGLRPNFPNISIYPAFTLNLGPNTVTLDHTDKGNVAYGWCAITALGEYNPDLGGHLILFDLGLVIRFPPGSTALIPSGTFRHGNTPIAGDKSYRMSMTQYCAGGLFRWVKYGFRTAKALIEDEGKSSKAAIDGTISNRVAEALGLFSMFDELDKDRADILRSSK